MTEILMAVLAGFLIGMSIALITFAFSTKKEIENERLQANIQLYHEILLKKKDRAYKYSPSMRKIINLVHVDLLLHQQGNLSAINEMTGRFEANI